MRIEAWAVLAQVSSEYGYGVALVGELARYRPAELGSDPDYGDYAFDGAGTCHGAHLSVEALGGDPILRGGLHRDVSYITTVGQKEANASFFSPSEERGQKKGIGVESAVEICVTFPHKIDMDCLGSSQFHVMCYREEKNDRGIWSSLIPRRCEIIAVLQRVTRSVFTVVVGMSTPILSLSVAGLERMVPNHLILKGALHSIGGYQ